MVRKIYICKKGELNEALKEAKALGIAEVAEGIPHGLKGVVSKDILPIVYQEPEPDQLVLPEDVDKLIKGRKVIESFRAELLSGASQALVFQEPKSSLRAQGFNSVEEFYVFNWEMCFKCLEDCYFIAGECDDCKGFEGGVQCTTVYLDGHTEEARLTTVKGWAEEDSRLLGRRGSNYKGFTFRHALMALREGLVLTTVDEFDDALEAIVHKVHSYCPPGHGFYYTQVNDLLFDWTWF